METAVNIADVELASAEELATMTDVEAFARENLLPICREMANMGEGDDASTMPLLFELERKLSMAIEDIHDRRMVLLIIVGGMAIDYIGKE